MSDMTVYLVVVWKDVGEVVLELELLGRVGMLAVNAVKLAGKLSCTRNYLIN